MAVLARHSPATRPMPRDPAPDSTLAVLRDPYRYIARLSRQLDEDVFEALASRFRIRNVRVLG
jgi:hypothetical protein